MRDADQGQPRTTARTLDAVAPELSEILAGTRWSLARFARAGAALGSLGAPSIAEQKIPPSPPFIDSKSRPRPKDAEAGAFYAEAIRRLAEMDAPFLVAGAYAVSAYTGISRTSKDLDIFCKAGDFARILGRFKELGYKVEIEDARWLGKVYDGGSFFDVIFACANGVIPVRDRWFENAATMELFGAKVPVLGAAELVYSKAFIQLRHRYDGPDVSHVILKAHDQIDWRRLLDYMEPHWEILLTHLLNFRWIYPAERDRVPAWLLDELLERLARQRELPPPKAKVCRGRMLSSVDYEIDVREWGFADLGSGEELRPDAEED